MVCQMVPAKHRTGAEPLRRHKAPGYHATTCAAAMLIFDFVMRDFVTICALSHGVQTLAPSIGYCNLH